MAVVLGLLSGCKVELYSQLEEQEGNEMLALLLDHGISSEKRPGKDNVVSLYVEEDKISAAVELLRKNGYPKSKFSTIKDIFSADKLITTPFEDRTRYTYGVSQEVAETLSQVDGVMAVRVHVVIPEEGESGNENKPGSAAVFIKHNPNYDFNPNIPKIKAIVSSSIAGLPYDAVNVELFAAQHEETVAINPIQLESVLSIELAAESVRPFLLLLGGLLGLVALSMGLNVYLWMKG